MNHRQFTSIRIVPVPVCDHCMPGHAWTALPAYYATEEPTNAEEPKQSSCCKDVSNLLVRLLLVIGKGHDSIWPYVRPDHEAHGKGKDHHYNNQHISSYFSALVYVRTSRSKISTSPYLYGERSSSSLALSNISSSLAALGSVAARASYLQHQLNDHGDRRTAQECSLGKICDRSNPTQ